MKMKISNPFAAQRYNFLTDNSNKLHIFFQINPKYIFNSRMELHKRLINSRLLLKLR